VAAASSPGDQQHDHDRALQAVIDDFGQVFSRYGVTTTFGRVFALLMVSEQPLSLDDIAGRLGVSKTGASVAARDIERIGLARRLHTPGSRRVLFVQDDNFEPLIDAQFVRIRQHMVLLERAEAALASGKAKTHVRKMLDYHQFWLDEAAEIAQRWRAR
jgi:DNA-binding transcriptional regulator GbsR (MarR family)